MENRFCAFCDQPVDKIPEGKQWTAGGEPGEYKHRAPSKNGIPGCGRQFLNESQTYTEADAEQ